MVQSMLQTWNPKSKNEPYAQSVVELMKLAKETVDEFFEVPVGITDDLVSELAEGLEHLFQEYIKFVEACGKKMYLVCFFFSLLVAAILDEILFWLCLEEKIITIP